MATDKCFFYHASYSLTCYEKMNWHKDQAEVPFNTVLRLWVGISRVGEGWKLIADMHSAASIWFLRFYVGKTFGTLLQRTHIDYTV